MFGVCEKVFLWLTGQITPTFFCSQNQRYQSFIGSTLQRDVKANNKGIHQVKLKRRRAKYLMFSKRDII